MDRLPDLFARKERTFSFELFPAKTEKGYQNLLGTIEKLTALGPDFISCTYGAGGGSRERTFDIVEHIQKTHHLPGVAHLTCVCHTRDEIKAILDNIRQRGICNLLALRGDPPQENPDGSQARTISNIPLSSAPLSAKTTETVSVSESLDFRKGTSSARTATWTHVI